MILMIMGHLRVVINKYSHWGIECLVDRLRLGGVEDNKEIAKLNSMSP